MWKFGVECTKVVCRYRLSTLPPIDSSDYVENWFSILKNPKFVVILQEFCLGVEVFDLMEDEFKGI